MRRFAALVAASLSLLTAACGTAPVATGAGARASTAPALGKADGAGDQADHGCSVVLRTVAREPNFANGGYVSKCVDGNCNWVWQGAVDVSRDAYPVAPAVGALYHLAEDATWYEVDAIPAQGGRPGFWHFGFEITEHLFGPDATQERLTSARIELVPFVRLAAGTRLFDHNRRPGDLDNYSFGEAESFAVGDDQSCPAVAGTISFSADWQQFLGGALHANGWLAVSYDLERLPQCRGTHNGYPAWDLLAVVKFLPGGQLVEGSVRAFETVDGTPTNTAHAVPLEVKIPADAIAVELWFHNYSGAGNNCDAWDSNYGANYRFDVWPDVNDPRCQDTETWASEYGGTPACVGYTLDEQVDATNCELFLGGIGDAYMGHYGIPFQWLEAYLTVRPQDGQLLNAGMLTRYTDKNTGVRHQRFSLGQAVDGATWKTGFTYLASAPQGAGVWSYDVAQVAFFVDVRRPSGAVVRLWQSHGGANYSWDDLFGAGTNDTAIPYGHVTWANDGAPVFDQKHSCQ
jgi:hypothetical protein